MEHLKDDSSESDEDTNIRHDRFRSERFQDYNSSRNNTSSTKVGEGNYNKNSSNKHGEKSLLRSRDRKIETTLRNASKNKYDDISSHSKSNRYDKHDVRCQSSTHSEKKHSDGYRNSKERDEPSSSKSNSKKLSSILMNFDKQIESRRLKSESLTQVGPTPPPYLAQKVEGDEEVNSVESVINSSIGPSLPPHLNSSGKDTDDSVTIQHSKVNETTSKSSSNCEKIDQPQECDTLSSMGPALPPYLQNQHITSFKGLEEEEKPQKHTVSSANPSSEAVVSETDETIETYGPLLPPKLEPDSFGPALPPNFKKQAVQGPTLPTGMTSDDLEKMEQEISEDEDTFGPMPLGKMNMTQYQLDLRAMDIKRKLEEEKSGPSKDIKKREEWMLELPPEKASNLGLGPRSFRMREGPDMTNRSAWTDTPADKKRKEEMILKGETEPVSSDEVTRTALVKERNETMDKISKVIRDKDRQETLLEIHQKKLKKKKKKEEKEGKKKERRPFDRNIDLQVHRFDEAQKKAIFKKAQLLDTRFSSGESKYL